MSEYKYKFSVIIPIYNVEEYLEETILSVINQTIGFEENIQMILVNDGSPDNSEAICLKYQEMYPNNIQYVYQNNAGVSAARNNGFKYAKGKYINYLDSDDKWSSGAFKKAYETLEKNEEIDVLSFRMKCFEAWSGYPSLDYKFDRDKIVDIHIDYDCIQLHVTSSFIRYTALIGKEYDTRIKCSEDAKLLYEIILEKGKYGIAASPLFYYRKRTAKNSAIDTSKKNKDWYFETMELAYKYVFDLSIKKFGKVIPFVQYYFMYDCQWRLKTPIAECLNEEEKEQYIECLKTLLKNVDDYIILAQRNIYYEEKVYALSLKYGYDVRRDFECRKRDLFFKNLYIYSLKNKHTCDIRLLNISNDSLVIEGIYTDYLPNDDVEVYFFTNTGEKYNICIEDQEKNQIYNQLVGVTEEIYLTRKCFKVAIPLEDVKSIKLMIKYRNCQTCRVNLNLNKLSILTSNIKQQYLMSNDNKYILSINSNKFIIEKNTEKKQIKKEVDFIKELWRRKKKRAVLYRILYYISKPFIKKDIWIVSDRTNSAKDNGMHLFKYLVNNERKAKVYFTISKKLAPNDYKNMKKLGKVLNFDSLKYKLLFLHSKYIISSQFDEWVTNPFKNSNTYMMDLYKFSYIFLQHGVTINDLSKWLHRFNKNIRLFITTSKNEYNSILNGYGYTKEQVKLTGFARYDNLNNKEKNEKIIAFMPTWRANIAIGVNKENGLRAYDERFKDTEYFNKYNNLINDKRLLEKMKEYGYNGIFVVHPCQIAQSIDYNSNDIINVQSNIPEYQNIFNSSSILITDYSSVAIDFAFLKKPVLYYQFDQKEFFTGHTCKEGYYNYERDGFGPVVTEHDECVNQIIRYMENNCKMEESYINKVNDFFKYTDNNNCKRIHEEILKLK